MKSECEIKAKIKELEEDIEWAYKPENRFSDYWEDIPKLAAKIDILKWILEI